MILSSRKIACINNPKRLRKYVGLYFEKKSLLDKKNVAAVQQQIPAANLPADAEKEAGNDQSVLT